MRGREAPWQNKSFKTSRFQMLDDELDDVNSSCMIVLDAGNEFFRLKRCDRTAGVEEGNLFELLLLPTSCQPQCLGINMRV